MKTSNEEIKRIFEKQVQYQWVIRNSTAAQRKEKIQKLSDAINSRIDDIVAAVLEDVRKPAFEVFSAEIVGSKNSIEKALKEIDEWMAPVYVQANNPANKAQIKYEPKGVCCIFGAWNYPFYLVIHPLVEAIAAGNCCMLKASDMTPGVSRIVDEIVKSVFDEQEVAVIHGDIETANELLTLPFNHIFFTGSSNVGKIVMAAAAKHLSTVTLELGGKSPVILDEKTDLKRAASRIAWGKIMNSGQTCIAPDFALIKKENEEEFVKHFNDVVNTALKNDSGVFNNADRAQIINEKNFNRIKALFDDAIQKGAKVLVGGEFDDEKLLISQTLLTDVSFDMNIMQEEIFAPILPIIHYQTMEDIIETVQQIPGTPLALYIFSKNNEFVETILSNTKSGGVCINDVMLHIGEDLLPFGGSNTSGIGSYHGIFGFKEFSHERGVLYSLPNPMETFALPPYAGKLEMLAQH